MTIDTQTLARTGQYLCRSVSSHCSRWCHHWLELLDSASADGLNIRRPGERMPPPGSGPYRETRADDWELAA